MKYIRKTRDTWVLQANYGVYGWEDIDQHYDWLCARENKRLYAVNAPEYPLRLVMRREKLA